MLELFFLNERRGEGRLNVYRHTVSWWSAVDLAQHEANVIVLLFGQSRRGVGREDAMRPLLSATRRQRGREAAREK